MRGLGTDLIVSQPGQRRVDYLTSVIAYLFAKNEPIPGLLLLHVAIDLGEYLLVLDAVTGIIVLSKRSSPFLGRFEISWSAIRAIGYCPMKVQKKQFWRSKLPFLDNGSDSHVNDKASFSQGVVKPPAIIFLGA